MSPPAEHPVDPARERAFLALLLLVGAGAVGVGLLEIVRSNATSLSAVLDLCLGASVLLVTWLFLAPAALPAFFGDPAPGRRLPSRPYLEPAPIPSKSGTTARSHPRPDPIIPKWADPLVGPRSAGPPRPMARAAALPPAGALAEVEVDVDAEGVPARPPSPSRRTDPPPELSELSKFLQEAPSLPRERPPPTPLPQTFERDDLELPPRREPPPDRFRADRSLRAEADVRSRAEDFIVEYEGERGATDVLAELDRIEAELRSFVPVGAETEFGASAGADGRDGATRS